MSEVGAELVALRRRQIADALAGGDAGRNRLAEVTRATGAAAAPQRDRPFYDGKIAAARFYVKEILPGIGASRRIIEKGDLALMELAEDAF